MIRYLSVLSLFLLLLIGLDENHQSVHKEYMVLAPYSPQGSVGLAFSYGVCSDLEKLNITDRGGWYYRWWDEPPCPNLSTEHVPMWAWEEQDTFYYSSEYKGYALFLNEPDRPDQSNLTPVQAAIKWVEFKTLCPYCRSIVLNVSRCDATYYYAEWRTAVYNLTGSYPDIAGIGCHLYGSKTSILAQIPAMVNWMNSVGWSDKQLWITEFARTYVYNGIQYSSADLQAIINEFEHHPRINRFAYYPVRFCNTGTCNNALFVGSSTTNLTPNGTIYANGSNGYP